MQLHLIRHPRPEIEEGICYGSTDIPALPASEAEAFDRLSRQLPRHAPVYTSPLSRCAKLAARLAHELDSRQPIVDRRLMELHFGAWEMQPWDRIPREEIDAWAADLIYYRAGGGENVLEAARRVKTFHEALLQSTHQDVIVICHAGTIRLLLACREHQSDSDIACAAASRAHRIGYGEILSMGC